MDDSNIGLTIAAALLGMAFFKKKKAEAELTKAMEEKPELAIVPVIPEAVVRVQDEIKQASIPPLAVVPVIEPSNPEPVTPITVQPELSTGISSQITNKLQELAQKQVGPVTQSVVVAPTPIPIQAPITTIAPSPAPTLPSTVDLKGITPYHVPTLLSTVDLKEAIIEATKPPIKPSVILQPEKTIVLDEVSHAVVTTPPTTQVAIVQPVTTVTTMPTISPATTTSISPPEEIVTLSDASQPLVAEVDRTIIPPAAAIGWSFKSFIKSVADPFGIGEKVLAETKRVESRVRKELKRAEQHIRYELRRFEIRVRKNLSAIATVLSVLGYVFPVLKVAAYALDAMAAYKEYSTAKKIKKQIEGQQQYIAEVNAETERMLSSPTSLSIKATGGTLGYMFKNRINSAFIPLVSISNTDLNDNFYTTMDMIPVLNAAQFIPNKAVGYICKIPFSGSIPLKLLYSFEMMDFVTVTSGSRYYQELLSNGYIEVKQLGYVSKSPQEGPFTSKDVTEVERIK